MTYLLLATINREITDADASGSQTALNELTNTPYDGMTFFPYSGFGMSCNQVRSLTTDKDLWPWVTLSSLRKNGLPDFADINGGRTAFLQVWRDCLRLTKDKVWPGILFDMEDYTGTGTFAVVATGADALGISPAEYQAILYQFGAELVDEIKLIYDSVTIWHIFTIILEWQTTACIWWITFGMLDRAMALRIPMKMLLGCETQVPYLCGTHQNFTNHVKYSLDHHARTLNQYPNTRIAFPFLLWKDIENTSSWVKKRLVSQRDGDGLDYLSLSDFYRDVVTLQKHSDYLWFYNEAGPCNYHPLNPATNGPFNEFLWRVREADKLKTEAPQRKTLYRQRIVNQVSNPAIFDSRASLAEFDRTAFVRPEELT